MKERQGSGAAAPILEERQVADYLRTHPDFFTRHTHLLPDLTLPHPEKGGAVSLIERQVELLREQKQDLKQRLQQLTETAHANEQLLSRIERLILQLIAANDLPELFRRLRESLCADFHADQVEVRLIGAGPEAVAADDPSLAPFARLLEQRRPVCGHLAPEQRRFLFGDGADEVASAAVLPLCEPERRGCVGLVGIGSSDPKRFHPEMGTAFLSHLGAVLARVVKRSG